MGSNPPTRRFVQGVQGGAFAITVLLGALTSPAAAQSDRPRIGLVLSGGGARGAAHVGVLRVLEELRVPVDAVAGTSMGAIVGGLYASGLTADEIAKNLEEVDWGLAFEDETPRELLPFRRKLDDQNFPIDFELGFRPWKILLPKGLLQGQRLGLILETLTLHVSSVGDFDELFVPFRAVAADLATGEPVVLADGSLATAMRASMSVPGVFAPVRRDGRLLIDGGITQNLPVDVVRALGADIVIAVDIATPLQEEKAIASAVGVTTQMIRILMLENSVRQKASLTEGDVLIEPKLGDLAASDFHRSSEAIAIGAEAARALEARLAGLALSPDEYEAWGARRAVEHMLPRIRSVRIVNDSRLADEAIEENISTKAGDVLDPEQLLDDIGRVYGYRAFESVDFELLDAGNGEADLLLRATEKSWGPSYLQFALNVEHDFEGTESVGFGVSDLWYPINSYGAEWRNELEIGSTSRFYSEFYQPLGPGSPWFVAPAFELHREDVPLFVQGQRIAEFELTAYASSLALGRQFSNWGELRVGGEYADGEADLSTGDPSIQDIDFEQGSLFVRFTYDSLDDFNFPHEGHFGGGSYDVFRESLGSADDFETLQVGVGRADSWAPHTLVESLTYATNIDEGAPIQNLFPIGGFLNLSGLSRDELFGNHTGLARLIYYRELGYREGVGFDVPLYAGASAELGGAFDTTSDITGHNALWAGSVFVAADTFLGPVFLGYGQAEGGSQAVYLFVGTF